MKKWEKPMIQELHLKLTADDEAAVIGYYPKEYKCCECMEEISRKTAWVWGYKCRMPKKGGWGRCGGDLKKKGPHWQCS